VPERARYEIPNFSEWIDWSHRCYLSIKSCLPI
jgi:hypothetical protein